MPNSTEVCFRNENAGAEQNIELESEFSLMRFISRFLRWPVEKRNKVLLSAEKLCIGSSDQHINLASEFIRSLCEYADKRDGDRRGS